MGYEDERKRKEMKKRNFRTLMKIAYSMFLEGRYEESIHYQRLAMDLFGEIEP